MAWRLAKSLEALRTQINGLYPGRSKASDGTIGNAEHAARSSDHNPWVKDGKTGVVTGMDITNDPAHGLNSGFLAHSIINTQDKRIKYVISNGKIASGSAGPKPWEWRPYTGKNPHNHHFHISVKSDKFTYDSAGPWAFKLEPEGGHIPVKQDFPPLTNTIVLGSKGKQVEEAQALMKFKGQDVDTDGIFGPKTERSVKIFQRNHGLVADGQIGVYTWAELHK